MRRASLIIAAGLSLGLTTQVQAFQETTEDAIAKAELRKKQADADAAEHEAEKQKYEKRKAAAEAQFGFLPKSPGDGSTTLDSDGGNLESEFLVAQAIGSAATRIATDINGKGTDILLVDGASASGNARLMAFKAEMFALKRGAGRALGNIGDPCPQPPPPKDDDSNKAKGFAAPLAAGSALIGALGDMLKTETKVTGTTSSFTADHLVRALLATHPSLFRTTFFDSKKLNEDNEVIRDLVCLGEIDQKIQGELASFVTDDQKKANAAKIARLSAASADLDALFDRLLAVEEGKPSLLALLYADAEISRDSGKILRVWVDASGGTFIARKNLWTNLGARSLAVTGGAVVSYLLLNRENGQVEASGLLKCSTDLVSLRGAHKAVKGKECQPLTTRM